MTDQQINAAIHEALGNPKGCPRCDCDECAYNKGLNYCADLNAMHEAERVLCRHMHASDSDRIAGDRMHAYAELIGYAIDAPARQRAEAFLKTLGKWEERL